MSDTSEPRHTVISFFARVKKDLFRQLDARCWEGRNFGVLHKPKTDPVLFWSKVFSYLLILWCMGAVAKICDQRLGSDSHCARIRVVF